MDDIEIRVHGEITNYKEKFYGFTVRQWVAIILIAGINIPLYFFGSKVINQDLLQYVVIFVTIPFALWGFVTMYGMNAERYVPFMKRHFFSFAKPFKYLSDKEYEEEQAKTHKERKAQKRLLKEESKEEILEESKLSRSEKKEQKRIAIQEKKQEKQRNRQIKEERKQARLLAKAKEIFPVDDVPVKTVSKSVGFQKEESSTLSEEDIEFFEKFEKYEKFKKMVNSQQHLGKEQEDIYEQEQEDEE